MKWHFESELVFFTQLTNLHTKNSCLFNLRKLGDINPRVQCVSFHTMYSYMTLPNISSLT